MKSKRIPMWLLLTCCALSCGIFVWAWLCAIDLLFFGLAALPAFFLQMLIRRGGKEWTWLLIVHAIILLCAVGIGGLIILLGENWQPLHGLLLAVLAGSALVGCLFELVIHRIPERKDESNEEA